ncbi:MAG: hypothetical protein AMJ79_04380 [Phycisphaerae bacterium SM23_30]|nr:MAG: hypothetical protein AMJ79_04380 [Phycisphaerae bacterium SM23_30]
MSTRAALITPPGAAAIAVVQIAGPESVNVLKKIFRAHRGDPAAAKAVERLSYGTVYDGEEIIDKVVVAADGDKQIVDINCHGGPRVIQRLLLLLQKHNVEITPWQQLHGADSIAEEVAGSLPYAKTTLAVRAIAAQHPGGLTAWCEGRIKSLESDSLSLLQLKSEIGRLLGTFRLAQRLLNPPTVVLVGPVNAGKSTLANALTGKTQSLVADVPGVTRDWTCQLTDVNGVGVNLIDTAGRRESADQIERCALVHADQIIARADLIVLMVEPGAQLQTRIDQQLDDLPETADVLIIVNKTDLLPRTPRESKYLHISALKGIHLDQLRTAICSHFGVSHFDPAEPLVFTDRQYQLLLTARGVDTTHGVLVLLNELLGNLNRKAGDETPRNPD